MSMVAESIGFWELPNPKQEQKIEWRPIPRVAKTIPFGYKVSKTDSNILEPIEDELNALEKAKLYLLENPDIATEIRDQLSSAKEIENLINQKDLKKINSDDSGNEINLSSDEIENQKSLSYVNQNFEVELSEIYVKSNILKKVLENAIGTEVIISVDVGERFNPLIAETSISKTSPLNFSTIIS